MRIPTQITGIVAGTILLGSSTASLAQTSFTENFQSMIYSGRTTAAVDLATRAVEKTPVEPQAQFALGAAQFLVAVENLGHGLHRHGLQTEYKMEPMMGGVGELPILRLPVPPNPNPTPVTYVALRGVLKQFVDDLAVAESTLSKVGLAEFDLPLDLAKIRLDFDGDGLGSERESLLYTLNAVVGQVQPDSGYLVDFDQSDAPWLQGYCHLLSAMSEFPLGHDWQAVFDTTFHNLFPDSNLASSELTRETEKLLASLHRFFDEKGNPPQYPEKPPGMPWEEWRSIQKEFLNSPDYYRWQAYSQETESIWIGSIADLITFVHLFNWPVVEPERIASSRHHLLSMIELSRENWVRIRAETDNAREWLPNEHQTGIFTNMRVDADVVNGWMFFLDEFEAVLQGDRLVPHWRIFERGINIRRMLEEPRTFDPVLIAQGSAVLPYLQEGDMITKDTVETIFDIFGGGFLAYFLWFN